MKKILFLISISSFAIMTNAQTWVSVGGGLNNSVYSHTELNNELYVSVKPSYNTSKLLKWDGSVWTTLCTGDYNKKLITYNNQIYCAYWDSIYRCIIAKFNGSAWNIIGISNPISSQFNPNYFLAMEVYNNELYVASGFTTMNGISANRIAKWNNSTWSAVGNGLNAQAIWLLSHNNILYAAGEFDQAGNISAKNIAKWDGSNWSSLGSGLLPNYPGSRLGSRYGGMKFLNNKLYVSGRYYHGPSGSVAWITDSITVWDGLNWNVVGINEPLNLKGYTIMTMYNNKLFFTLSNTNGNFLKIWDGNNWSIDTIINNIIDTTRVYDFFVFNNELYMAGEICVNNCTKNEGIVKFYYPNQSIIDYNSELSGVSIYPNPASKNITIEFKNILEINTIFVVYDITGRKVMENQLNSGESKYEMNTEKLESGVYFYKLQADKSYNGKIIISK